MNYGFIRIKQTKYDDSIIILQDALQLHRECYYRNDSDSDYNNTLGNSASSTTPTNTDGSNILCNYYLNNNNKNIVWHNAKITIDNLAYAMALANHKHQQEHHQQQLKNNIINNENNDHEYYNNEEESLENLVTMYIDMLRW